MVFAPHKELIELVSSCTSRPRDSKEKNGQIEWNRFQEANNLEINDGMEELINKRLSESYFTVL